MQGTRELTSTEQETNNQNLWERDYKCNFNLPLVDQKLDQKLDQNLIYLIGNVGVFYRSNNLIKLYQIILG